jgi:hypothetical protein
MGPKKGAKDEVIDINTLPPWAALNCIVKYEGHKERGKRFFERLYGRPKSFYKRITREDVLNFAKEKGLYVDPTQD